MSHSSPSPLPLPDFPQCVTGVLWSWGVATPKAQSIQLQPTPSFDTNWFLGNDAVLGSKICVWKIFNIRLATSRKRSIRQRRLFETTISFIIWVQNSSPGEVSMVSRNIKQYGFSSNLLPRKQNQTCVKCIPYICHFFSHGQNFWRIKFTPKNANFLR